ncbi:MAG: flagellar motor switch protein FliM [Clostridia bacterium]|nr:flagellar motor switch protein FliM [Clostridia bacterium]
MADVLSQSEIDALLSALNTGEVDTDAMVSTEKKVRDYDFTRPSKFSREHLKTLQIIYDNYSRALSSYFSGYLRMPTHITVDGVEALTYKEFSGGLSNPLVFTMINFAPLKGSIMAKMSAKLAFAIIDRVLGGEGNEISEEREFTEIEVALVQRIISKMAEMMREPWENVHQIHPRLEKLETNVQFAEIIEPNEMVALITLNVQFGELTDMINICIPHMVIEPVMHKLSTKQWFSVKREEKLDNYKDRLEEKLTKLIVPIRAVLGTSVIKVDEFADLQVGDVIKLDTDINSTLKILVGDIYKFDAKPGMSRHRNSILITKVIKEQPKNDIDEESVGKEEANG